MFSLLIRSLNKVKVGGGHYTSYKISDIKNTLNCIGSCEVKGCCLECFRYSDKVLGRKATAAILDDVVVAQPDNA
eukprot:scaffold67152_cov16-Prasinocladus_malaysianus.AAC.1